MYSPSMRGLITKGATDKAVFGLARVFVFKALLSSKTRISGGTHIYKSKVRLYNSGLFNGLNDTTWLNL
jgi:hypothetical protein